MTPRTVVIMPALDEAEIIMQTLEGLQSIPTLDSVIVIDDGSYDSTGSIARIYGVEVLTNMKTLGKGAAMNRGIDYALSYLNPDFFMLLDADLGCSSEQAALLLKPLIADECDLSIAAFQKPAKKSGLGILKKFALAEIQKARPEFAPQSPLSGQRAMPKHVMEKLLPLAAGFGVELIMTLKAIELDFRIQEVQTTMCHKQSSNNLKGIMHRYFQYKDAKKALRHLQND